MGIGPRLVLAGIQLEKAGPYYVTVANGMGGITSPNVFVRLDVVKARPIARFQNGDFRIAIDAAPGSMGWWYVIEASTNLVNWLALQTNQVTSNTAFFTDTDAIQYASRFYRSKPLGPNRVP